jgi:hypothetical protein
MDFMALKKCEECGQNVARDANQCPHCGHPLKKKSKTSGCGCLVAGIILLGIIGAIVSQDTKNEKPSPSGSSPKMEPKKEESKKVETKPKEDYGDKTSASVMAEHFIQKKLVAPSTAKFSSSWDEDSGAAGAVQIDNGVWQVWGYVDSQNSFGAMLRAKWEVHILKAPYADNWVLKYLRFGDEEEGVNLVAVYKAAAVSKANALRQAEENRRTKEQSDAKARQEKEWREKRSVELKELFASKFQDRTGQKVSLSMAAGSEITGILKQVLADSIILEIPNGSVTLLKVNLSTKAQTVCFKDEFIKYMANQKLEEEARNRLGIFSHGFGQ